MNKSSFVVLGILVVFLLVSIFVLRKEPVSPKALQFTTATTPTPSYSPVVSCHDKDGNPLPVFDCKG